MCRVCVKKIIWGIDSLLKYYVLVTVIWSKYLHLVPFVININNIFNNHMNIKLLFYITLAIPILYI